ncbi:isocitrate lyase/phosphoenolpyruvate mutase family protein [Solirubrobacter taibaiensis]|nr:isocitrate lyase/phosphoenolpyruvate mutase family protein [Solirubrobacter taibaiensis]
MTSFADLHQIGDPLILPNAWDFASAAALVAAGFEAIGTTSLGVAAGLGKRDGVGNAWEETRALALRLVRLDAHVTIDFEHGFSDDPAEVAEHAAQLEGVAGINLEDRYGDPAHHAAVIAAVKDRLPDLFVNARTDTHWLRDGELAEALSRARLYVEAGADGVFVPGLPLEDVDAFTDEIDAPLNVLYQPGQTVEDLAARGAARISTGSMLFRAALQTGVAAAVALRAGDDLSRAQLPSYDAVDSLAGEGGVS